MRLLRFSVIIFWGILLILSGCSGGQSPQSTENHESMVHWQTNSHAKFFRIGTTSTDTLLEIYFDSTRILQKFHKGKNPQNHPEYISFSPSKDQTKIAVLTSAFSQFLNQTHSLKDVIAVDQLAHWTQNTIAELPQKNQTSEIQKGGNLNIEKLIQLKPNLTFTYTLEPKIDQRVSKFTTLVYIQNHFEVHPLAKAEWIKVFGYFLHKSSLASSLFQEENLKYISLVTKFNMNNSGSIKKPKIMVNLPYSGIWWVPQKNNYLTQLIYDAGGDPVWITPNLSGNNSVQISTENALAHIHRCNVLLHPGSINYISEISDDRIKKEILSSKPQVWQNELKMESTGANPFWDIGSAQPHLLLQDLQRIFYQNGENAYFYNQIKLTP